MRSTMKVLRSLVWVTQLGLSVVTPIVAFVLLAVWLHNRFSWGTWVIWVGVILGIVGTVGALRNSLRAIHHLDDHDKQDPPPCSFNDHD